VRQPVLERVTHGVPPSRSQPDVQLLVELLELVADLDLRLTADLLADARPSGLRPRSTAPIYRFLDASQ
jgi:hypothetical protein